MGCSTCMEDRIVIPCQTKQCDWVMCHECTEKWYTHKTICPACRNENGEYLKSMETRRKQEVVKLCVCVTVTYVLTLAVFVLLGRLMTMALGIGPVEFLCGGDAWVFFRAGLLGSIFAFILFSVITACIYTCVTVCCE